MRFFITFFTLILSTSAFAIERPQTELIKSEDTYISHRSLESAISDLRVRKLQKLVQDQSWTIKRPALNSQKVKQTDRAD